VRDVEPELEALARALEEAHRASGKASRPGAANAPRPAAAVHRPAAPVSPASRPVPQPKAVPLQRRQARRIARGSEEIEARLDLHGMTQDDAHWALVGFVRRCHAAGLRTVLVITGKGGAPTRGRTHDEHGLPRERGVLKRNVPKWLAGPEVGALVISYSTAHVRHGGEGALYVRLRRKG
jgi:DNA-nicking Smr family endonuclease